jgi:hypothetical protein
MDAPISQIYFITKLYMFRRVLLSIIRSLFTVHSAMVCVIQVCRHFSSRTRMELPVPSWSCSNAVWHIPLLSVRWINSWWWTEELSEKHRVSWQNKFVKLVHLVGFITKKFVTIQQGHMKVKYMYHFLATLKSPELYPHDTQVFIYYDNAYESLNKQRLLSWTSLRDW